jgi:hypothetical protein
MSRALVGTLLVTCLAISCSKDKSESVGTSAETSVKKKSTKKSKNKPAAAPSHEAGSDSIPACTMSMSEAHLTFQNGLAVKGKPYSGTSDAKIEKEAPTTNFGTEELITPKGGGKPRHGLLRWDLSSIAANTTIRGACLAVFVADPSAQAYSIYELLRAWTEAEVTWTRASATAEWEVPGAWGAADLGAKVSGISAKTSGLQTVGLPTELVQKWINDKAANHGVIVANKGSYNGLSFSSANSPTASQRPSLLIWQ